MSKLTDRKHLLHDKDPFEEAIDSVAEFLKENGLPLGLAFGIGFLAFCGVYLFAGHQASVQNDLTAKFVLAQNSLSDALAGQKSDPATGKSEEMKPEEVAAGIAEAQKQFKDLVDNNAGSSAFEQSLYLLARTYLLQGDIQNAVEYFNQYNAKFPKGLFRAGAYMGLAACNERDNRPEGAIKLLEDYITENSAAPSAVPMKMDIARLLAVQKKHEEAKKMYQEIVDLGQENNAYYSAAVQQRDSAYRALGQEPPKEAAAPSPGGITLQ